MNNGVKFVLNNFERTLELIDNNAQYLKYKNIVQQEYSRLKNIKYTGNMYQYFKKFESCKHKHAADFMFLEKYGLLSNEKMAEYLKNNYADELKNYCGIDDLVIGEKYTNAEVTVIFGCSPQGGLKMAKATNSLVAIVKHNRPLYDDYWTDDGILQFTGKGRYGDQLLKAENRILAESNSNGISIHLFEGFKNNELYYQGKVKLIGKVYEAQEFDENGLMRRVYKYPLKKINDTEVIFDKEEIEESEKVKSKEVRKKTKSEIKEKAKIGGNEKVVTRTIVSPYRERNQYVAQYTKDRAKGICDLCGEKAPFIDKDGEPYLESHHVITLADGGPDKIYNTVAICPNCHRKIHNLEDKKDINKLQEVILEYLLKEDDKENIKKWNELFDDKIE